MAMDVHREGYFRKMLGQHTPGKLTTVHARDTLADEFRKKFSIWDPKTDANVRIHFIGVWDTVEEALDAGYSRFGLDVFLAQKITDHEKPVYFSRNLTRCQ